MHLFADIANRVPARIGRKAIGLAVGRLGMEEEDDLYYAIGAGRIEDRAVMEALRGMNREAGITVLVNLHHLDTARDSMVQRFS